MANVRLSQAGDMPDLRAMYHAAMKTQIVHDQIHTRPGCTRNILVTIDGQRAGFATIAIGGPWRDAHAMLEFWLRPEFTAHAAIVFRELRAFDPFLAFVIQTIQELATSLIWIHAESVCCEKIVFRDRATTRHIKDDVAVIAKTDPADVRHAIEIRSGGGEWELRRGDEVIGSGGVLFHYNSPYGDVHMEIAEAHRGQGYGRYLIQELKRVCSEYGQRPAARCSPTNAASYAALCHAGFEPSSQILVGRFRS